MPAMAVSEVADAMWVGSFKSTLKCALKSLFPWEASTSNIQHPGKIQIPRSKLNAAPACRALRRAWMSARGTRAGCRPDRKLANSPNKQVCVGEKSEDPASGYLPKGDARIAQP